MKIKKIKNKDLKHVSGGWTEEDICIQCPNCNAVEIPEMMFVKSERNGCSMTYYYKCPKCNHEWEE